MQPSYIESTWMDEYRRLDFKFEGRNAIVVFPKEKLKKRNWLLKMEYFGAFQDMERAFVERGYHLAYLENINRWGLDDDQDAKARFCDFLASEFDLERACIPVGMSCGGLHAIKFAARHPEAVRALYLDAPVVNLLSCPFGMGMSTAIEESAKQEALDALGLTVSQMIAYREHPLDKLGSLIQARIPTVLVYGDADSIVPFEENGRHVVNAYQGSGIPFLAIGKPGCDHHPHGPLDETGRVIKFIDSAIDGASER